MRLRDIKLGWDDFLRYLWPWFKLPTILKYQWPHLKVAVLVGGSTRKNVSNHCPGVTTATDAKPEPVSIIGQENYLQLSPFTEKLKPM